MRFRCGSYINLKMPSVVCMATCIKFSRSLAGPAGSLERDALNNLFLTILLSSCALTICRASILTADRSCAAQPLPVYHRHLLLVERGQERPAVLGQAAAHLFRAGRRHHALERVGGGDVSLSDRRPKLLLRTWATRSCPRSPPPPQRWVRREIVRRSEIE